MVKAVKKSKSKSSIPVQKRSPLKKAISPRKKLELKKPGKKLKPLGEVSNYFEHVGAVAIKLKDGLKVGDKIKFVGGEVDFEQEVKSMQIQHEAVQKAKKGDEVGIKIKEKVRKGYKVFKA